MPFQIQAKQTVVFTGDSITDCGRRGANAPLGDGYVRMCSELIDARYPERQVKVINTGIGGNTVWDLAGRWYDDVLRHKPDWVSVKIGINDLHRRLNNPENEGFSVASYEKTYDEILQRVRDETKAKLILVDPFYISTEKHKDTHRARVLTELPKYIKVVEKMARKHKAKRVQTHEMFKKALKYFPPDRFCPEPVHPYASGHIAMAQAWLTQMGY